MVFEKGNVPWNKGRHHSEETKQRMSEKHSGKNNPMYGKHLSEEHRRRISKALQGRKRKTFTDNWLQHMSESHKNHIPWNRGLTKETDERVAGYAKKLEGRRSWKKGLTKETDERVARSAKKMEGHALWCGIGKQGARLGGVRHQNLVKKIANHLNNGQNDVKIEKAVSIGESWRIIDVLVNDKICYEIGGCSKNKIEELEANDYTVIHLPYSSFEGGSFPCV